MTPIEWVWQGFEGPADIADATKAAMEASLDPERVGAVIPPAGMPAYRWSVNGVRAMWAVHVNAANPLPLPAGMLEANPTVVGRIVGA